MPNDNTHALLPCPFCGHDAELWGEDSARMRLCRASCPNCGTSGGNHQTRSEAAEAWNTRTPAEPKAGDWVDGPIMWCGREVEFDDFGVAFRHLSPLVTPVTYSTICKIADRYRALSSAAPRITEEMVERVGRDEWLELVKRMYQEYVGRNVHPYDTLVALLRQQGPPPFTPTQTEE